MEKLRGHIEDATNEFIDIYKLSSDVTTLAGFLNILDKLKLYKYKKISFDEPVPKEDDLRLSLALEAKNEIKSFAFWKLKKLRSDFVDKEFLARYPVLFEEWNKRKTQHENDESNREIQTNNQYQINYETQKELLENAITGNREYIECKINEWVLSIELPVKFNLQYEYNDSGIIKIDLDLPEIDELPKEKAIQLASGQIKRKEKTQKELKHEYMRCIFGLAVFISSYLFDISPVIHEIVVSGYTQRRNKRTGENQDDYIYSVKFHRSGFVGIDFNTIDIISFFEQFENRYILSQTYELKTIIPF